MSENQSTFCSEIARDHGVPLIATATRGDLWFLVEYDARWESKAFEQSTLPESVKAYLEGIQIPGTKSRILMIRQDASRQRQGIRLFMGHTAPQKPRLFEFQLDDYPDILELNLSALAAGETQDTSALREAPLYLVCTNGKRDLCCARTGPEIYQAIHQEVAEDVWQSSHIGGHNKAPNTLFFPHGVEYGQTGTEQIRHLVQLYQQGQVGLEHYRGRVCFDPPLQAAEHFWRQATGIIDLPGMQVESVEAAGENEWRVAVQGIDGNHRDQITILRQQSDIRIPVSCAQDKLSPISSFHRID